MPRPLTSSGLTPGVTYYVTVRDADGLYYDGVDGLEAFDPASFANYAHAAAVANAAGDWTGAFPAALPAGRYTVSLREQLGATPALTDPGGEGEQYVWDGTDIVEPPTAGTIAAAVRDVDNASPAAGSLGADAKGIVRIVQPTTGRTVQPVQG